VSTDTEGEDAQPQEEEGKGWKFPSFGTFGDYIKKLLALEGTVGFLKEENKRITNEMILLQRQLSEHNGQLKVLGEFVRVATSAQVEAIATKSAIKTVESMIEVMRNARSERE
jgi:hypothetical protein